MLNCKLAENYFVGGITKKFLIILCLFGILFASSVLAEEKIDDFQVSAKINSDSSIEITEKIQYNFSGLQKHGIYRNVPVVYDRNGTKYKLRVNNIKVLVDGLDAEYTTSNQNGNLQIKIGNADQYITGVRLYVIKYNIKRAINFFDDHDEFYWNATGNLWQVPIAQSALTVSFPKNISESDLKKDCFAGPGGSIANCLSSRYIFTQPSLTDSAIFVSDYLNPGSGLTAVISFPKGVINKPSLFLNIWYFLLDNFWIFLPFLVFVIMLYFWYERGRDPKPASTIIAQYDVPDNLTSAEIGTILDNKADNLDISADIISLAVRGYIKINRLAETGIIIKSSDYELEKLKSQSDLPNVFEQKLMASIFDKKEKVKLSDLKNEFYKDLEKIKESVYDSVTQKGYFTANPEKSKKIYLITGAVFMFSSFYFFGISLIAGFSVIVTGFIIMIFGYFMPQLTIKGQRTKEYILGLKLYLGVAEKDRLEFHNAPEKNPQLFEKLLPFAIALKVEEKWAKQFEGIYNSQPSWYNDPRGTNFNTILFVSSLNSFTASANSNLVSTPSRAGSGGSGFGGGGFSGGGFGGGGGGSW